MKQARQEQMYFSTELDRLEAQASAIEKDLIKASFFKNQLELARAIAAKKIYEATETISLLKRPRIIVSLPEFSKIKKTLRSASADLKSIDKDLTIIYASMADAGSRVRKIKKDIEKIKENSLNNILSFPTEKAESNAKKASVTRNVRKDPE